MMPGIDDITDGLRESKIDPFEAIAEHCERVIEAAASVKESTEPGAVDLANAIVKGYTAILKIARSARPDRHLIGDAFKAMMAGLVRIDVDRKFFDIVAGLYVAGKQLGMDSRKEMEKGWMEW